MENIEQQVEDQIIGEKKVEEQIFGGQGVENKRAREQSEGVKSKEQVRESRE